METGITRRGLISSGAALTLLAGIKGAGSTLGASVQADEASRLHNSATDKGTSKLSPSLSTMFPSLDSIPFRLIPSDLTVVAGRPSSGKTSFVLNVVHHLAVEQRIPVGYFALEISRERAVQRLLCLDSGVSSESWGHPEGWKLHVDRLLGSTAKLLNAPLYIDDTPALSTDELMEKARAMKNDHGIKLVMIDYVQLMRSSAFLNHRSQREEVTCIVGELKAVARELRLPVLAVSSLWRGTDYRLDKRPLLSDAARTGCELHADNVLILYRDGLYEGSSRDEDTIELILAKHRNGLIGTAKLRFLYHCGRFEDRTC